MAYPQEIPPPVPTVSRRKKRMKTKNLNTRLNSKIPPETLTWRVPAKMNMPLPGVMVPGGMKWIKMVPRWHIMPPLRRVVLPPWVRPDIYWTNNSSIKPVRVINVITLS